jgi:hypothetical protein
MGMARLHGLALVLVPATLGMAACDDYNDYPPATPVDVPQGPVDQTGQPPGALQEQADSYTDTDPSALTDFHSTLDPHGQWVEDPTYGTVWTPNPAEVGPDFAPYETSGHWAYDDADYVWVSDYDWGWAPFHYGRWVLTDAGWEWIPGREYAPAWVYWQMGYAGWPYVGWGPAYPGYIWRGGVAVGYMPVGYPGHYYYCPQGAVFSARVASAVVVGPQAAAIGAHVGFYGGASVGGQVAAGPAGARVAAAPAVGAVAHGPAPASLGIAPENVAHVSPDDKGTAMAKNFAKPSTATKMGAHPPTKKVAKPATRRPTGGYRGGARSGGGFHGGGHR